MAWPYSLLLLLSCLVLSSVAAQPADGTFRGWSIASVASHPTSAVVYVLDYPNNIRAVNRSTGAVLQRNVSIDTEQAVVLAIGADGLSNRVYALMRVPSEDFMYDDYRLLSFTAELHPIANMSLASVSPRLTRYGDRLLSSTLPIDNDGNVCLARQLSNGTVLVHIIAMEKRLIRTWTVPFPTEDDLSYSLAAGPGDGTLYFQSYSFYYYYPYENHDQPLPLFIVSTDGEFGCGIEFGHQHLSRHQCNSRVAHEWPHCSRL